MSSAEPGAIGLGRLKAAPTCTGRLKAARARLLAVVLAALGVWGSPALAQETHDHSAVTQPGTTTWQWQADGAAFFGFNYQRRKFRDFSAWESQNWLMATGTRTTAAGSLQLQAMISLEPLTLRDLGSPQVFQTGETFRGAPLIDYQHPHDLLMSAGARYRLRRGAMRWDLTGAVVGTPAFGPTPFMHRSSAADNPQAPLSHHYLDSTHITPGVFTAGVGAGAWRVAASVFHGREPDENRFDLDLGALDSYSVQLGWTRGSWSAQISGARLEQPERVTPYDADRLSASVAFERGGTRSMAFTAAFGQKREIHGNLEAYLLEGRMRLTAKDSLFTRIESVAKDILDAGFHPAGTFHRHRQSQVGALSIGYVRDAPLMAAGRFGIGADVTGYLVPDNLKEPYGSPVSFHVFLRYRRSEPSTTSEHLH